MTFVNFLSGFVSIIHPPYPDNRKSDEANQYDRQEDINDLNEDKQDTLTYLTVVNLPKTCEKEAQNSSYVWVLLFRV